MTILHVPVTFANIAEWVRRAAGAINQLITGKQDADEQLTSLAGLDYTGNANKVVRVTAGEDGFELASVSGGSLADGDYGDIVVSGSGTVWSLDSGVVTTAARTVLDDASTSAMLTTLGGQPLDSDLTALAANSTDGFWAHTGAGTGAARTLTAPAAGITISNPAGIAGNPTFALADDLSGVEGLSTTGLAARTAASTWTTRTLTAPAAGITVSNGDGVSGNPTLALADDLSALEALSGTNTIYYRSAASTWTAVNVSTGLTFSSGNLTANGWVELLNYDFGSGAASTKEVDVTGYKEIHIIGSALVHAASIQRNIQVSVDGGSTWKTASGDYADVAATGVETNNAALFGHNTATTSARDFVIHIMDNDGRSPVNADMVTRQIQQIFKATSTAINRIRLMGSSGGSGTPDAGNFTAGTLRVRGRV